MTGADGRVRMRAEREHVRQPATTVGRVDISGIAYRSPVPNLHVADAEPALTAALYSRPLQIRARSAADGDAPCGALARRCLCTMFRPDSWKVP